MRQEAGLRLAVTIAWKEVFIKGLVAAKSISFGGRAPHVRPTGCIARVVDLPKPRKLPVPHALFSSCRSFFFYNVRYICEGKKCIVPDKDGDGQSEAEGDCDDSNPKVFKGAKEVRDGLDNDCDGKGMDGDFDLNKVNGASQTEWEFTEFKLTASQQLRPMSMKSPVTFYSVKKAVVEKGAKVAFQGATGARSIQAYTYRDVAGGVAGPGAGSNRGATGPGGCHSQNHPSYRGIGTGGGQHAQCTSYGPGGSGAGHQAKGGQGGRSPNHNGPPGGNAYGSDSTPALSPGSGGGAGGYGGARNQGGSAGGGGGGTFRLVAPSIDIKGEISVRGGDGGMQGGNSGDGGTGGGGSGGTIWLTVSDPKGTLSVTGTCVAEGGKGGRILYRGGTGGTVRSELHLTQRMSESFSVVDKWDRTSWPRLLRRTHGHAPRVCRGVGRASWT